MNFITVRVQYIYVHCNDIIKYLAVVIRVLLLL